MQFCLVAIGLIDGIINGIRKSENHCIEVHQNAHLKSVKSISTHLSFVHAIAWYVAYGQRFLFVLEMILIRMELYNKHQASGQCVFI